MSRLRTSSVKAKPLPNRQRLPHRPPRRRHPVHHPIRSRPARLRQRQRVPLVVLVPAPPPPRVHRPVIRIDHQHPVPHPFQAPRHPLAFRPRLHQHLRRSSVAQRGHQPIPPRRDTGPAHLAALVVQPADLAFPFVQSMPRCTTVGLLSCALERVHVERQRYPAEETGRFIPSVLRPGALSTHVSAGERRDQVQQPLRMNSTDKWARYPAESKAEGIATPSLVERLGSFNWTPAIQAGRWLRHVSIRRTTGPLHRHHSMVRPRENPMDPERASPSSNSTTAGSTRASATRT